MTSFSFYTHVSTYVCVCKIDDVKPIVQSSCVHTRHVDDTLQMLACMSGMHMPNLNYAASYMQIVSHRQWNKLYEHVHVLRYDFPHDTRCKSC